MKRPLVSIGYFLLMIFGGVIVLYVLGHITGSFRLYTVPSSAMEPVIKVKSIIISSNLIKPVDGKTIVFNKYSPDGQKVAYVKQLIGLPGDNIEIRNGYVYRNGKFADDTSAVLFQYKIPDSIYEHYNNIIANIGRTNPTLAFDSGMTAFLKPGELSMFKPSERSKIVRWNTAEEMDSTNFFVKHRGTKEFLGPIKIPKDSCFVIGANRDNSEDSRYFGYVALKDIRGVVIGH